MTAPAIVSAGPISVGRRSHHPLLVVLAVLLGAYMTGFNTRLFSVGLTDLRGALGLGQDEGAWLSTAALAPQILIAPCVAWLVTVFGVRRVLVAPALLYAGLSLVMPLIHWPYLVSAHMLHGLLLGLFVPATLTVILRNLPMKWWVAGIAVYVFRQAFTLNSGVELVGLYTAQWGWQWLYWQDVVLAPLMALCAWYGTPREPINRALLADADWGGMLLFGSGLAMLYIGFDHGNRLDWLESGLVVSFLTGGALLMALFFVNEALVPQPWASLSVVLSRNVGIFLLVAFLYTFTSASNSSLVPNFLTNVAHLRPEQSGPLLMAWGAAPLFVLMPLTVWLLGRIDGRYMVIVGLTCFAVSALWGTRLTSEWRTENFTGMVLLQAIGHCLTFLPIVILSLANSNPARATSISAYIQVLRIDGLVMATALTSTWLRLSEQVHSNLTGQHVLRGDPAVAATLSGLTQKLGSADRALATLSATVQREATVLSYIDGFWLCFAIALVAIALVAFIGPTPTGPLNPARK